MLRLYETCCATVWVPNKGVIPGRLILCDVPQLVLSPQELEAAGDTAEEAALVKIFDAWQSSPKPKWEIFTSRIKLVEGGFRRSLEEDAEDRKQK